MALEELISQTLYFGNWVGVVTWVVLFASFLVFLPFNRKAGVKPAGTYLAFIVASAFEMFGIPLSLYFVTWAFGVSLPRGVLWGHTLEGVVGYWGMYVGLSLNVIGGVLIYRGWKVIHQEYWSREEGEGRLVTEGVYSIIRHPQYTGFILMTLGLLVHWATLPLIVMWPLLVVQYYRLAKKEEEEMVSLFGERYHEYRRRVPMFIGIPRRW